MDLRGRRRDRGRLRSKLSEGTRKARQEEARLALPLIAGALEEVRSDKAAAQTRFDALREAAGEPEGSLPVLNPVLQHKSRTYGRWAPVILIVEAMLAAYTASLTISGSWMLHLVAGVMATLLFCGLAKLMVSTQVDGGRLQASSQRLERQLGRVTAGAALLLGLFFVARFFPFAELVFSVASTLLSFVVAYIVALCLTLAELLGACNREVRHYTRLALLESELTALHALAEGLAEQEGRCPRGSAEPPSGHDRATGVVAVGLVLLLVCFAGRADGGETSAGKLTVWIDGSGSMAAAEWERVRAVLMDPLPLLEVLEAREVAVTPFWAEAHALYGTADSQRLPERMPPPACEDTHTVFSATRKARQLACDAARAQAGERWQETATEALEPYRETLAAIDATADHPQTCLFPVLNRIAASGGFHLVVTDGAHANCGPEPARPIEERVPAVVVLVPDSAGSGIAARMEARTATLHRLYPGLAVVPSWQVSLGTAWEALFTTPESPAEGLH